MGLPAAVAVVGKTLESVLEPPDSSLQTLPLLAKTLSDMSGGLWALQYPICPVCPDSQQVSSLLLMHDFLHPVTQATDRAGHTSAPLLAQGTGTFLAAVFQYAARGILLTIKSYAVRTALLGTFFFLVVPLAKMAIIKMLLVAVHLGWLPVMYLELQQFLDHLTPDLGSQEEAGALPWLVQEAWQMVQGTYDELDEYMMS